MMKIKQPYQEMQASKYLKKNQLVEIFGISKNF